MRKAAGSTGVLWRTRGCHGPDRSPREGPSEGLPSGMTAEEPFLRIVDKEQKKDTKAKKRFYGG